MKEANRQNAEYVIVLGEEEIRTNSFKLKKMSDGTEKQISDLSEINSRLLV